MQTNWYFLQFYFSDCADMSMLCNARGGSHVDWGQKNLSVSRRRSDIHIWIWLGNAHNDYSPKLVKQVQQLLAHRFAYGLLRELDLATRRRMAADQPDKLLAVRTALPKRTVCSYGQLSPRHQGKFQGYHKWYCGRFYLQNFWNTYVKVTA